MVKRVRINIYVRPKIVRWSTDNLIQTVYLYLVHARRVWVDYRKHSMISWG